MDFTYAAYEDMIKLLCENGYTICNYCNYSRHDKCAILRHDIDMSLEKALYFAELENKLGVSSTYFVLLSTDIYNAASAKSIKIINRIVSLGHSVGLHFDETKYDASILTRAVEKEIAILSAVLDMPITSVSMHRPSKVTLAADYRFNDAVNSYAKIFFEEFKYISDSRRHWREPVIDIIKSARYKRLHILTHPFWYNEEDTSPSGICKNFIISASYERYIQMRENIRDLGEFVGETDIRRVHKYKY